MSEINKIKEKDLVNEEELEFLNYIKHGKDVDKVEKKYGSDYIIKFNEWIKIEDGEVILNKEGKKKLGIESWQEVNEYFHNEPKTEARVKCAEYLANNQNFYVMQDTNRIWIYENGIYNKYGEEKLREILQRNLNVSPTTHDKKEIIEIVKDYIGYSERPDNSDNLNYIPLENGLYNLKTDKLENFDPNKFFITKIPVKYDPKADCPKIKEFFYDIFKEEDIPRIQEFLGLCIYREYFIKKGVMLYGSKHNGKTKFLNLLEKFLGKNNIAGVTLHKLIKNQFAPYDLYGKLANLCDEMPAKKLTNAEMFKKLTGRGIVRGEEKHKGAFYFHNYATLFFHANNLPKVEGKDFTGEGGGAFWDRWEIIKFPYTFTKNPENEMEKKKDPDILKKIVSDEEFSGLLNWAIEGLKRLKKNQEFTETQSGEEIKTEWISKTDSLKTFIKEYVEKEEEYFVTFAGFEEAYKKYCNREDRPVESPQKLGRRIPQILKVPSASNFMPKVDDKQQKSYKGIRLTGEFAEDFTKKISKGGREGQQGLKAITRKSKILNLYPDSNEEPDGYDLIEEKAEKELGIDPDKFAEINAKLTKNGEVHEARSGMWKRV